MDEASFPDFKVGVPKATLMNKTEGQDVTSKAKKIKSLTVRIEDKSNPFQT